MSFNPPRKSQSAAVSGYNRWERGDVQSLSSGPGGQVSPAARTDAGWHLCEGKRITWAKLISVLRKCQHGRVEEVGCAFGTRLINIQALWLVPPCPPCSPQLSGVKEFAFKDWSLPLQLKGLSGLRSAAERSGDPCGELSPRGCFGILFTKPSLKTLIDQQLLKIHSCGFREEQLLHHCYWK